MNNKDVCDFYFTIENIGEKQARTISDAFMDAVKKEKLVCSGTFEFTPKKIRRMEEKFERERRREQERFIKDKKRMMDNHIKDLKRFKKNHPFWFKVCVSKSERGLVE